MGQIPMFITTYYKLNKLFLPREIIERKMMRADVLANSL